MERSRSGTGLASARTTPGRTPSKKRAFGTKLSANSPLPSAQKQSGRKKKAGSISQQYPQQQQQKHPQQQLLNSAKKAQLIPPRSITKTAERGALKNNDTWKVQSKDNNDQDGSDYKLSSSATTLSTPGQNQKSSLATSTLSLTPGGLTPYKHTPNSGRGNFPQQQLQNPHAQYEQQQEHEQLLLQSAAKGKNLMDSFASPSVVNHSQNSGSNSSRSSNRRVFTPQEPPGWTGTGPGMMSGNDNSGGSTSDGGASSSWTNFTPKISWKNGSRDDNSPSVEVEAGSNANVMSFKSPTSMTTSTTLHRPAFLSPSMATTIPSSQQRQQQQEQSNNNMPTTTTMATASPAVMIISPTASLQSTSTAATALSVMAAEARSEAGQQLAAPKLEPSEYAIHFPPGPLHLDFEPVTTTAGKPTGCSIAKILPGFDTLDISYYFHDDGNNQHQAAAATGATIQVNDLLVSINGIPILSQKHDIILNLLKKVHFIPKVVVFRSIETLWRSQFARKTMRNVRTGKRVATALAEEMMEGELYSWVETPTQVEVGRRRRERRGGKGMGERKGKDEIKEEAGQVFFAQDTRAEMETESMPNKSTGESKGSRMMDGPNNTQLASKEDGLGQGGGTEKNEKLERIDESSMTVITSSPPPSTKPSLTIATSPTTTTATAAAAGEATAVVSLATMTPTTMGSMAYSTTNSLLSPPSLLAGGNSTPSTLGSASPFLFSPSNVKKMSRIPQIVSTPAPAPRGQQQELHDEFHSPLMMLSPGAAAAEAVGFAQVRTVKKSNVHRSNHHHGGSAGVVGTYVGREGEISQIGVGSSKSAVAEGSNSKPEQGITSAAHGGRNEGLGKSKPAGTTTKSSSNRSKKASSLTERIGKALTGASTSSASDLENFEHSLRLKKGVLKELKNVHLELEILRINNETLRSHNAAKEQHIVEKEMQITAMEKELSSQNDTVMQLRQKLYAAYKGSSSHESSSSSTTTANHSKLESEVEGLKSELESQNATVMELREKLYVAYMGMATSGNTLLQRQHHKQTLEVQSNNLRGMIDIQAQLDNATARVKELEEERLSFSQYEERLLGRVNDLEGRLEVEEAKVREVEMASQEAMESLQKEVTRRETLLQEKSSEVQLLSNSLASEMAKAKKEADVASRAFEEERLQWETRSSELEEQLSSVNAELAQAKEDANRAAMALEEECSSVRQREASHAEQVRSLEEQLKEEKESAIDSDKAHSAIVAKLDEHIHATRQELEKERMAKAELAAELGNVKEDSSQREAILVQQVHNSQDVINSLKEDVADKQVLIEEQRAAVEEHTEEIANMKQSIVTLDKDNNDLQAQLEQKIEEVSALNEAIASSDCQVAQFKAQVDTLAEENDGMLVKIEDMTADLSKAKHDAEDDAEQIRSLEQWLEEEEQKALDLHQELEKERSMTLELQSDLTKAREGAALACKALEEERQRVASQEGRVRSLEGQLEETKIKFDEEANALNEAIASANDQAVKCKAQVDSLTEEKDAMSVEIEKMAEDLAKAKQDAEDDAEQIRIVEQRLEEEEQKAVEFANNHSAIVAKLDEQIAMVESDLEKERSTTLELQSDLTKVREGAELASKALEEERQTFCLRVASREERVRSLEEQLKELKLKSAESSNDYALAVAKLEECISAVELDRDDARQDLEKEQLASATLRAELDKAKQDANESSRHEASLNQQLASIKKQLEEEKQNYAESMRDHSVLVAKLEEHITVIELDRNDALIELEAERVAYSVVSKEVVVASKALEEERSSFSKRDAIREEQIHSLEECLTREEERARKIAGDHSALVAKMEEQISVLELTRDDAILELEKEQSVLSSRNEKLAKAEEAANESSKALEEERLSSSLRVSHLEECLAAEEERYNDIVKEHNSIIAKLEEQISVLELDRDNTYLELKEERAISSDLRAILAKAEEKANRSSEALEKERLAFQQREIAHTDQVRILEEQLEDETHKAIESSEKHSAMIAELEEQISAAKEELAISKEDAAAISKILEDETLRHSEQVRKLEERLQDEVQKLGEVTQDCDNAQSALLALSTDFSKVKEDAADASKAFEDERSSFSQRETGFVQQISRIEERLAEEEKKATERSQDHLAAVAKLEEYISVVELDRDDAKNEVAILQTAKDAAEERVIALEEKIEAEQSAAAATLERVKHELKDAISSNNELLNNVTSLSHTREHLATQLHEKESAVEDATAKIISMQEEAASTTSQLLVDLDELRTAAAAAEKRATILKSSLDTEKQDAAEKLIELEKKLEAVQNSNAKLTDQVSSLANTNQEAVNLVNVKDAALEDAKLAIATLKEEALALSGKVAELSDAKVALEGNLEAEQLGAQELELQLEIAEEDAVKLSKENNDLSSRIEHLQSEISEMNEAKEEQSSALQGLTENHHILINEKNNLSNQLSELLSERDGLVHKLDFKTHDLLSLQEKLSAHSSIAEELQSKNNQLSSECAAAEERVDELTSEVNCLENKLEEMNARLESTELERDDLMIQLETAETKIAETINQCTQEIAEVTSQNSELANSLFAISAEKETLAANIEYATSESKHQTTMISNLESTVVSLTADLVEANKDFEELLCSSTFERDGLAFSLGKAKEDISRLEKQIKETNNKADTLEGTVLDLKDSNQRLFADLDAAKSQNADLMSQLDETIAKYSTLQAEQTECLDRIDQVTIEKEEISKAGVILREEIAKLELAMKQKTDEVNALHKAIEASNDHAAHLKAQVSIIGNERDARTAELVEIKRAVEEGSDIARNLKQRLAEEERKSADSLRDQSMLVARLDEHILVVESDRDDAQLHLKKEQQAFLEREREEKAKVQQLLSDIAEMQNEASLSKDMIHNLEKDLESHQVLESQLTDTVKCLKASNESLETERSQLIGHIQMLELEVSEGNVQVSQLLSMSDSLKKTRTDLAAMRFDRSQLELQITDLKHALSQSEETGKSNQEFFEKGRQTFMDEIDELTAKISEAESLNTESQAAIDTLTEELARRGKSLETLSAEFAVERESLTKKLEANRTGLDEAMRKLQMAENDALNAKEKHSDEVKELLNKLEHSQNEASRHKNLVDDLKYNLAAAEGLLDDGDEAIEALTKDRERLHKQAQSLKDEKKSLDTELARVIASRDEYQKEASQLKSDNVGLDKKVRELSVKLHLMEESYESSQAMVADLRSRLDKSEVLLGDSHTDIQNLEDGHLHLEKQVNDLNMLLENSENSLSQQKDENQSLAIELGSITASRDELRREKELTELDLKSNVDECLRLQKLLKSNEKTNSEQMDENQRLTLELESVKAEVKVLLNDSERLEGQTNDLKILLKNAEAAISNRGDGIESLTIDMANATARNDDLQSENESLLTQLTSKQSEIDRLGNEVRDLSDQVQLELELQVSSQSTHAAMAMGLTSKLEEFKNDADQNKALAADLMSQLQLTEVSLCEANTQILSLKEQLNDLNELLEKSDTEKETLASELEAKVAELSSMSDSSELLKSQISKVDADKAELLSKISGLESALQSKEDEIRQTKSQHQNQNEAHQMRQNQLLSQKQDLTATVKSLTAQVQSIEAQSRREVLSHELNQKQLLKQISDLQNLASASKIKCSHLVNELEAAQSALRAKDSEMLEIVTEKESMANELESNSIEARRKQKDFEAQLSAKEFDIQKEKARCNDLSQELESAISGIKSKEQEVVHLEYELSSSKESVASLHSMNSKTKEVLEEQLLLLTSEKESLQDRIHHLEAELNQVFETLSQQEELAVEKEERFKEKEQSLEYNLGKLSDDLNLAKVSHEQAISAIAESHDTEKSKLHQRISSLSIELQSCKGETKELRQTLEEGIALNTSLRNSGKEKEQKIDQLSAKLKSMDELLSQTESAFASEKQKLIEETNQKQASLQASMLTMATEKDALVKELEKAEQTEMKLRSKMHETHLELIQLSMDLTCVRGDVVMQINGAKSASDEAIQSFVFKFEREKEKLQNEIQSLSSDLKQQQKQFHEELSTKNESVEACTTLYTDRLEVMEQARLDLASENEEMKARIYALQEQCHIATKDLEDSTPEKASYEKKIHSLNEVINEKCLLIKSQAARLAVASILEDEIVSLRAEVECVKHTSQWEVEEQKSKVSTLQLKLQEVKTLMSEKGYEYEALVCEINSMEERLEHQNELIESDLKSNQLDSIERELRDLCIQIDPQVFYEASLSQSELVDAMLQTLKGAMTDTNDLNKKSDPFNDSREHQLAVCEFLSEIDEAKQRVVDMSQKLESEAICRKQSELQFVAAQEALASAKEKITTLEQEIEERVAEVNSLERTVELAQKQHRSLEQRIVEMDKYAKSKEKEAKGLESQLEQVTYQQRKSELKYEQASSEIESCQELAIELKGILIEKNKEIESKEETIMSQQYTIDDLSSRAEGWKASLDGLVTDAGSPDEVADILVASKKRQDALSEEIAKLNEESLRMAEDFRQQTSMHKAIVEGLESQCDNLAEDNADMCDELREKEDYIVTLEEAKEHLEVSLHSLRKDLDDSSRKLSDLQKSHKILRQQKIDLESSRNEVITAIKKLADVATVYTENLEGFSNNLSSQATWSENLAHVSECIEHASMMNQKYMLDAQQTNNQLQLMQASTFEGLVTADALTPRARGNNSSFSLMNIASQHSEILEDLRNMKTAINAMMSSPKLTPTKPNRQEESTHISNDEYDEDLYYDLLRAHEQLESLSIKIEAFQDDQRQWEEREAYFNSRIIELEEENQIMKDTPAIILESEQEARMKEAGALIMFNFQQRCQRAALQRALQTWSSQCRMSKHLSIAKEMAKELAKTRKKVLLLKSHLE